MGLIRNTIVLITPLLFCLILSAQQKHLAVYQADSILKYALVYKELDSLKNGRLLAYYESNSDQIAIEKSYYFGKQSGVSKTYFPKGQLMEIIVYQNGLRHGDYTRFDEQGDIVIKAKYRNDLLHGFWTDRKKNIQGRYRYGLKHGKWEYNLKTAAYVKRYYQQGQLTGQPVLFQRINLVNKQKEDDGDQAVQVKQEQVKLIQHQFYDTMLIQHQKHEKSYKIRYIPRDSIAHPSMYKAVFQDNPNQVALVKYIYNGYLNGLYQRFYPNGNIYLYANYSFGKLNGLWRKYAENGKLVVKGNFKDGKRHGTWHYQIGSDDYQKIKFKNGVKKK